MDSINLDKQVKSIVDKYLTDKIGSCVDTRHNNRLNLIIIGMIALFILILGIIWLWNAPDEQITTIKFSTTIIMVIILIYLIMFSYGNLC
jgi:hypothetical protein